MILITIEQKVPHAPAIVCQIGPHQDLFRLPGLGIGKGSRSRRRMSPGRGENAPPRPIVPDYLGGAAHPGNQRGRNDVLATRISE
jgi:hypothetical protein